jgi:hypothetical protein
VRLTVNKELCNGESYAVECINLHDESDQALVDGTSSFTGAEGAKPMVDDIRSEFVDASTINVFYGEDMRNLGVGGNYLVRKNGTGTTIAVVDVAVPSNDCAGLTLASPTESATYYDVVVDNASVTDLAGNYVEPLGDTLLLISPV